MAQPAGPATIREARCLLLCEVEVAGERVAVGSTHLSHHGSGERRLQAEALAAHVANVYPVVLAGDLNAPIESDELAPLRVALTDAFDGASIPPSDPLRMSSDDGAAIDHVLARGATVRACRVARETADLSDHWPVVADLVLEPIRRLPTAGGHGGAQTPSRTGAAT